jgi:hypothetical protein
MSAVSPRDGFRALIHYQDDDPRRSWSSGREFSREPVEPLIAGVQFRPKSTLVDFWQVPLPIVSDRLRGILTELGVQNIRYYQTRLQDRSTGQVHGGFSAFNLLGRAALPVDAEIGDGWKSDPRTEVGRDGLNRLKNDHALMFRLEKASNAIVVHPVVRDAIIAAGIDTVQFYPVPPTT